MIGSARANVSADEAVLPPIPAQCRFGMAKAFSKLNSPEAHSDLSIAELLHLHGALTTMVDVAKALWAVSTYLGRDSKRSRAEDNLYALLLLLDDYREIVVEEARTRTAPTALEAECRGEILLRSDMENALAIEDIAHQASCAASMVRGLRQEQAQ